MVTAAAAVLALGPLSDNSFLTHLATGRLILERGSVPSTDPYTFTAHGEPWVVQSWLMSVVYATAESVAGLDAVRVIVAALVAAVAAVGWRLLRPADGLVVRLALGALFLLIGSGAWSQRPLTFGLLAFALVVLAGEGGFDARWLVPLGWVWANAHGSFPLGLVYLCVAALGARLDGRGSRLEQRCLALLGVGVVSGVIGPLGLRALSFPVELVQRQDVLRNVVEWQAPRFLELDQRAFLLQLLVAIVLLVRRPTFRSGLILGVFTVAALLGSRNIGVASIALLPAMAGAVGQVGSLRTSDRPRGAPVLAVAVAVLALLAASSRLSEPALRLRAYPVDALAYLDEAGIDTGTVRLAAPEIAGNFMTLLYGAGDRVFYDDRFDMFPDEVSAAHLALTKGEPGVMHRLRDLDIDLVLLKRSQPMTLVLAADPDWRALYTDERWFLVCRRGADVGGTLHAC
jgi:hypothetical protein